MAIDHQSFPFAHPTRAIALHHWWRWVRSGVDGVSLFCFGLLLNLALTQPTTETIAFGRVGWANDEGLAISSRIMSICPPYFISVRTRVE
ncbi:hypothetical protein [Moorena sp. SIO2C4]|uniref:hypothetical protein n=1 Tax=Moorena sp. SIO2C4 TaxID=2607824 RepID=UPI0013CC6F61|nr:hypothetical protein [Moorena sp. SIO2C4]NES46320.1 hypothetical protein [Moorena sp. SIO2C4]